MIDVWFTSDTHFGHKNILKYEKEARPFDNIYEMNEAIIDRWNGVVKPRDIVYHLGDVSLSKNSLPLLEKLNGHKRLVMGNHDVYPIEMLTPYFEKLYGAFEYKGCILTHIPIHPVCMGRYKLNIHGHLHSKNICRVMNDDGDVYDVIEPKTFLKSIEDDCYAYEAGLLMANINNCYFNVSVEQNDLTPINFEVIREYFKL